jgi:hypothetical protein
LVRANHDDNTIAFITYSIDNNNQRGSIGSFERIDQF